MSSAQRIREAVERNVRAMERMPSIASRVATTVVRATGGLRCEVEEGAHRFTVDMPEKVGGTGQGPNPGVLGRAALGSCLAIGYMMWAARLGVPIAQLEVQVEADYDARGEYGVSPEVPPGYLAVRCVVTIESDAAERDVMRVVERAEAHSSWLDIVRRPVDTRCEVRVRRPERSAVEDSRGDTAPATPAV